MTSTRTWGTFFDPHWGGGGKWRPFRFRSPSWMTSFAGTGNEVIQDGDRKRKGRHFPPPPQWGSKKVPYTTKVLFAQYTLAGINACSWCTVLAVLFSQCVVGLARWIYCDRGETIGDDTAINCRYNTVSGHCIASHSHWQSMIIHMDEEHHIAIVSHQIT